MKRDHTHMKNYFFICIGACLGASLRYFASQQVQSLTNSSSLWGTLLVNCCGCFLMGLLGHMLISSTNPMLQTTKLFFVVGLLGSFTTFSAFSFETQQLIDQSKYTFGLVNILANVGFCWISLLLGRLLAKGAFN